LIVVQYGQGSSDKSSLQVVENNLSEHWKWRC